MKTSLRFLFALVSFSGAASASAQTPTPFVAIHDLTVEGRDPPNYLRRTLDDNTTGVMRDFDVCYAGRQAQRADLTGAISLRLWVSAQQVIRVTPEGDTVGDPDLYACVKTRLLALTLPPDAPRAGATVRFRIEFTPPAAGSIVRCEGRSCSAVPCGALGAPCCPASTCTDSANACIDSLCAVPPPPPPPPPSAWVSVTRTRGALATDAVTALLPTAAIHACVDASVTRDGVYTVTFSRTGRVTVSASSPIRPTAVSNCVKAALRTMTPGAQARTTTARVAVGRVR